MPLEQESSLSEASAAGRRKAQITAAVLITSAVVNGILLGLILFGFPEPTTLRFGALIGGGTVLGGLGYYIARRRWGWADLPSLFWSIGVVLVVEGLYLLWVVQSDVAVLIALASPTLGLGLGLAAFGKHLQSKQEGVPVG